MADTTINAVTPVNTQAQALNPYATTQSMATDFFGSQAFGKNSINYNVPFTGMTQAQTQYTFKEPVSIADALVQQHYYSNNPAAMAAATAQSPQITQTGTTYAAKAAPTAQDYYLATQIANQFANNQYLISPNTSFFQNDMFAKQLVQPSNGINYMG